MLKSFLHTILCVLFCLGVGNSQIYINEYSASNLDDYADDYAKYEDWIELHNAGSQSVNLAGWFLSDKEDKPMKWEIPAGLSIPGNGYVVFWCSGRNEVTNTGNHTNFKLTQTKDGETLMLTNPSGVVMQQVPLQLTQLGHSVARDTDGADSWLVDRTPTPYSSNIQGNPSKQIGYAETPELNLVAGFYQGEQMVTVMDFPVDGKLRFTTDGTEPTAFSPLLNEGDQISVEQTMIVKVKHFPNSSDYLPSKIAFATYFINENFTLPVFSVGADDIQDLANGEGVLRPQGTLEYFDKDLELAASSYGELNRHGQDSWILPHRSLDWISRDEMGYNKAVQTELFTYSDRDEYQRFMFRASGDDNYPANGDNNHEGSCHIRDEFVHTLAQKGDMKLDVRAVERVIVFLNGEYWGLYGLRERPADHDYTEEYYNQGKYDIQYLTTWGSTQSEYGGQASFTDWGELRDFILDNDMGLTINYNYVKDNLQVRGLCDYMIANLNTVASDWLNYNTGWWRGLNPDGDHKKWGYILWDNDATFDYYINYSGVPNTNPDAVACDIDDISDYMDVFFGNGDVGKHEKIFLKLLDENAEFQQLYYSRQADLMNTVFSCENMTTTFDSMIATIAPEMPRQIARWGGSMAEWEANVATMRTFIEARCTLIDDGMTECYELGGPYPVTLHVEPAGAGEIEFNTLDINSFPWTGEYFSNMDNLIEANANDPELPFLYWKTEQGSIIFPDSLTDTGSIEITGEEQLTAVFGTPVAVFDTELDLRISAYPTVVHDNLILDIDLGQAQKLNVVLISVDGRPMQNLTEQRQFPEGKSRININMNAFFAGTYFIRVETENSVEFLKVIVAQ